MGPCSSTEYEPGPITPIDEKHFPLDPEPPIFAPAAKEFHDSLPGFFTGLDAVYAALEAETTLDVGGGIIDALTTEGGKFTSKIDAEALAHLQTAQDGFRVVRDQTASLQSWLSPDVQQPPKIIPLNFWVDAPSGARVAGALITIDADFGNGTTRVTDGNGLANFGVAPTGTVSYTIVAEGFALATGLVALGTSLVTRVTLQPV